MAYLVSPRRPRFLSESLVIEAIHSITNSGQPQDPWGLSYSANMHAGAHLCLSVYMGIPFPSNVWKRSHPVRERVSRHSVSWQIIPSSGSGPFTSFLVFTVSRKAVSRVD